MYMLKLEILVILTQSLESGDLIGYQESRIRCSHWLVIERAKQFSQKQPIRTPVSRFWSNQSHRRMQDFMLRITKNFRFEYSKVIYEKPKILSTRISVHLTDTCTKATRKAMYLRV